MIIPTAEPFYFPGNRIGCLLVHGFTGSPKEMHWMGEYLAGKGYSVLGIRLAGHATQVDHMLRTRWQDWLCSVEDGYSLLKGCADHIFLIGLSMGGILSLLFSAQHPVTGVVSMSVPYELPEDPRSFLLRRFWWLMPKVQKGPADWHNPEAAVDHVEYPYLPTRELIDLDNLLAEMRKALPKVFAPVLLIHSKEDGSVPPSHADKIFAALGSQQKQLILLENSGHVIPREPDREFVFKSTHEFVERVTNLAPVK